MTNKKQRTIEREINARLYRNLTREGIPMDHLDPTHLADWPLIEYPSNKADYVNLLPPSYRNPFSQTVSTATATRKPRTSNTEAPAQAFKESLANEWSITNKPEIATLPEPEKTDASLLLITIAGILMAVSLALNSTLLTQLFF